jgi:hypothetical protein
MTNLSGRNRRLLTGKAASLPNSYTLTLDKPDFFSRFVQFNQFFDEEIDVAMENLAKAGVTATTKALDKAVTPRRGNGGAWGEARMSGERNGVKFRRYGNSSGRNDTGNMIRSLAWDVSSNYSGGVTKARFGWIFDFEAYFFLQERGFTGFTKFNAAATAARGVAMFSASSKTYKVPGANSLPQGLKTVNQIKDSFFSQAWNRAADRWYAAGRKSSPGSYKSARARSYSSGKRQGKP